VPLGSLGPERQVIVELCVEPVSVAEISGRLSSDTILRVMQGSRAIS
jgi:hypothetical protein